MKIAVPTEDGRLAGHFGHCACVTLFTVSDDKVVDERVLHTPPHKPGLFPVWLQEHGADAVVAAGMGQRALALFSSAGIHVIVGASSATPAELVSAYISGTLTDGENTCSHGPDHRCKSERQPR